MTSEELIARIREVDPEGTCKVSMELKHGDHSHYVDVGSVQINPCNPEVYLSF